jgi:membrane fusion protein, heavy metal efflux system
VSDHEGDVYDEDPNGERTTRPWRRYVVSAVGALVLLAIGVTAGVMWSERRTSVRSDARPSAASPAASSPTSPGMAAPSTAAKSDEPVEVTLTPEAVARAGIKTAKVRGDTVTATVSVPATVTSNAYRDTKVHALVGGIVRQVSVELGSAVRRGQPLAVIFSGELADAQMKYLSMRAMLEADHQKLVRTEKLLALGAVSRQELEEVTAVHAAHETEVAAARQRLILLGFSGDRVAKLTSADQVVSEVIVPAPGDGIVVTRSINPGQVVGAAQELFVVTDLSTVWVIGDLYEKDFPHVRVGAEATVTVPAVPGVTIRGRVTYIDPRVDPAARTAKVRVEVPNRSGDLRLGMFVNASFQTAARTSVALVPRAAVQAIGERTVVYVPLDDGGRFAERPFKAGRVVGEFVEAVDGLKPGERVVTDGSFFLRAEAGRSRTGG